MLKYISLFITLLFFVANGTSQTDNFYSLYLNNANIINPAYAGSHESLDIGIARQWGYMHLFSFESKYGAPRFFTANIHAPIGDKFGVGFSFENAKVSSIKGTDYNLDVSYKLLSSEREVLSFGVKFGYSTVDYYDIMTLSTDGTEITFTDINNKLNNIGGGLFYHTNNLFTGLAFAYYKGDNYYDLNDNTDLTFSILNGFVGYVFNLSDKTKLKPSIMIVHNGLEEETWCYLSGKLYLDKVLELGAHYNFSKNLAITIGSPVIAKTFKIGLNIDFLEKSSLQRNSYQNITVFTNFNIDAFQKKQKAIYF